MHGTTSCILKQVARVCVTHFLSASKSSLTMTEERKSTGLLLKTFMLVRTVCASFSVLLFCFGFFSGYSHADTCNTTTITNKVVVGNDQIILPPLQNPHSFVFMTSR